MGLVNSSISQAVEVDPGPCVEQGPCIATVSTHETFYPEGGCGATAGQLSHSWSYTKLPGERQLSLIQSGKVKDDQKMLQLANFI